MRQLQTTIFATTFQVHSPLSSSRKRVKLGPGIKEYRERVRKTIDWAQGLGIKAIPLHPQSKHPIGKRWNQGDGISWEEAFTQYNVPNIGLLTGENLGVLDIDSPEAYDKLKDKLPQNLAPTVKTGKGIHLYFRPTKPFRSIRRDGFELLGEGGQVVAPPSIHPDTLRPYEWVNRVPPNEIPPLDVEQLLSALSPDSPEVIPKVGKSFTAEGKELLFRLYPFELKERGGGEFIGKCLFHEDEDLDFTLNVEKGVFRCFHCNRAGRLEELLAYLIKGTKQVITGNDFRQYIQERRKRIILALQGAGYSELAKAIASCGSLYKAYPCECGRNPAFPISCGSAFDPICREKRLRAWLWEKDEEEWKTRRELREMGNPIGIEITPKPTRIGEVEVAKEEIAKWRRSLFDQIRNLQKSFPALKNLVHSWHQTALNGEVGGRIRLVIENPGDVSKLERALGELEFKVNQVLFLRSDGEAAQWLYEAASSFSFNTPEDLAILIEGTKGMPLVRGWGKGLALTGGKGFSKKRPKEKPICPFCGRELKGKGMIVPAEKVKIVAIWRNIELALEFIDDS